MVTSILIVDDDPAFLALAAYVLEGMGIEVVARVLDAASAVEAASATRPSGALVDVGLPDRNGVDLAYELAALPWKPTVVLTSADADAGDAVGARPERPPIPFVPKDQLTDGMLPRHLGRH
ncbi:MAG TPA: response regulator [Thermoleophilaceae bacterium]|nr:response regulator [Thermoleophilaceae bacterium]